MKKIDKLVLKAFFGPFVLTFLVVVFIFLIQYLIRYFPDLVGKGLGAEVFLELLFYFSINVTPVSLPLAVLLSSLICFGNLGEFSELTAVKSAGISLVRAIFPIFMIAVILCFIAFFINNNIVPKANLKAFSLMYDVRQKKPTFDFKEGAFYNGLPGYSIKVTKKYPDGKSLKGVMIYDHTKGRGNIDLIMADSGQMFMMMNDKYLVMELYNGNSFSEVIENQTPVSDQYVRNNFVKSRFVFSMESFDLQRTQEELFANNKIMRNVVELQKDVDSLHAENDSLVKVTYNSIKPFYNYSYRVDSNTKRSSYRKYDYNKDTVLKKNVLSYATNTARSVRSYIDSQKQRMDGMKRDANSFEIEWYKKFTFSFACIAMFLIGAPLGAIIKKGGLGVPTLVSIIFFIIYYILTIVMEKWTKEGLFPIGLGMWLGNLLYFPIGLFFLNQARSDSRIFEMDYFAVLFDKIGTFFKGIFKRK
ncbi:MAG: LptF/LptG family permease [Bacteroidota bacterium]|nr:LptF/LptG family permease [Bacteroidota bacterium]